MAAARARTLGIAVSVAAHLLVLGVLAWRLSVQPVIAEPQVVNVALVRVAPRRERPPPAREGTASTRKPYPSPAPPLLARAPQSPPGTPAAAPAPDVTGDRVRHALRARLGCRQGALADLSAEERARCEAHLAQLADAAPEPRVNLNREGRYDLESEPYLARRPKKGCKPRMGGRADPMGKDGAAGGITCVMPF